MARLAVALLVEESYERARGETGDVRCLQHCEHGCSIDAQQPHGALFLTTVGHDPN
jgi:predicted metal-binding protein